MAQFDVHENAGRLRDELPYVLNVQSSQFDAYARRIVVPLAADSERIVAALDEVFSRAWG